MAAISRTAPRDWGVVQKCAAKRTGASEATAQSLTACVTGPQEPVAGGIAVQRRRASWTRCCGVGSSPAASCAAMCRHCSATARSSSPRNASALWSTPSRERSRRARTRAARYGFPRVQSRAAEASRRAPDREEGVTDRNHALPAAALEGCAVGVLPDANGDVDVPVLELLLDDGQIASARDRRRGSAQPASRSPAARAPRARPPALR